MRFQTPLIRATLVRRYKRFLADCVLPDGREITAHVANPGAMTGLAEPGTVALLRDVAGGGRKLDWSWCLAETVAGVRVCVDTGMANRVMAEALTNGAVPGLEHYATVRSEKRYDDGSRIDFLLSGDALPDLYLEVKSVTLSRQSGLAEFPDTKTARGAKHMAALARVVESGARAMLVYVVMRSDADRFTVASDIDPAYAAASRAAREAGVETFALATDISTAGIEISRVLPMAGAE